MLDLDDAGYSYIRFSTPGQRDGDSHRRQTAAAADWCERHGVRLDRETFYDPGRSAFLGDHRKNPDRCRLAYFLKLVEEDKIPRGSYLIIESLDRLTREHVRAGLMLCLGLIEKGIRLVQLSPSELIYDENSDEMSLMLMIVELSRGHRESARKSEMVGKAWKQKKLAARESGDVLTSRLPAWIELREARLHLVPERAAVVRKIFRMAIDGYGLTAIIRRLITDEVPPFTSESRRGSGTVGGRWSRSYLGNILRDRRAMGEFQPRDRDGHADGPAIVGYYPPAVDEDTWAAARGGAAQRHTRHGREATGRVNIFQGLLRNARDGGTYFVAQRTDGHKPGRRGSTKVVLINTAAQEGRQKCVSFPYPEFERAILTKLVEVDPREVLGTSSDADEVMSLAGQLATVERQIAEVETEILAGGSVPSLARVLRAREEQRVELARRLAEARQRASSPLSETWGECQSLVGVLEAAKDQTDIRLRLRSALRRVVAEIWCLFMPLGRARLAAVQVVFNGGKRREYFIFYQPTHVGWQGRTEGWCAVKSAVGYEGEFDLSNRELVPQLEAALLASWKNNPDKC